MFIVVDESFGSLEALEVLANKQTKSRLTDFDVQGSVFFTIS